MLAEDKAGDSNITETPCGGRRGQGVLGFLGPRFPDTGTLSCAAGEDYLACSPSSHNLVSESEDMQVNVWNEPAAKKALQLPKKTDCAFRDFTGCLWPKLGRSSARTAEGRLERWDGLHTRYRRAGGVFLFRSSDLAARDGSDGSDHPSAGVLGEEP